MNVNIGVICMLVFGGILFVVALVLFVLSAGSKLKDRRDAYSHAAISFLIMTGFIGLAGAVYLALTAVGVS